MVNSNNTTNLLDSEAFETANGLWKGKKPPYVEAGVIRNTNFTSSGRIDLTDVAVLAVEEKQLKTRTLQPGDIILERSGGGPKQPVGRVVYFEETDGTWSFSNFTSRIRVRDWKRFDSKFVFYFLLHFYDSGATDSLQRRTTGIRNLDWKAYKESVYVPLWSLPEQHRIAAVLSLAQRAIEQQERLIALTTKLKKALMHKLFTDGTRGEPQKQTEIGLIPGSWEVAEFEQLAVLQRGKDLTRANFRPGPIPVAGSNGVIGFHDKAIVSGPGVTVGRSGSVGKVTFYANDFWAHNTALYVRDFKGNHERFTAYYLELLKLSRFKTGASVPTLDRNSFRKIPIAIPDCSEQKEIAEILESTDMRITGTEKKKEALSALFRTLLHQLMTAQIRVNDLDFVELGIDVGEEQAEAIC